MPSENHLLPSPGEPRWKRCVWCGAQIDYEDLQSHASRCYQLKPIDRLRERGDIRAALFQVRGLQDEDRWAVLAELPRAKRDEIVAYYRQRGWNSERPASG